MTKPGWWVIAGFALGIATAAAAAYKLGNDAGLSASAAYKAANEMNLTELTKQAVAASKALRDASTQFSDLVKASETAKTLKVQNETLTVENARVVGERDDLRQQLSRADDELTRARAEISRLTLTDQTFGIGTERAEWIADGNLFVVLRSHGSSSWIVSINGKSYDVDLGAHLEVDGEPSRNKRCELFVKEYDYAKRLLLVATVCRPKTP